MPGPLALDLAVIESRARDSQERLDARVCSGLPERDARHVCRDVRAEEVCQFRHEENLCPWERLERRARAAEMAVRAAGVPARECALVCNHAWDRTRLRETEPIRVMRARVEGKACEVEVGGASLKLRGSECLIVLAGPRSTGKTVAACYFLSRSGGGLYRTAYPLSDAVTNTEAWISARTLVIDQIGREYAGASDYSLSRLEHVVDARYAEMRTTVLLANLNRKDFMRRYGGIIESRLEGDGLFVEVKGRNERAR
jgi:hypothetical protein